MIPPLSFRSEARNLVVPARVKDWMIPPLSFRSGARNLVVPDKAKDWMIPPLSFRSEARNLVFPMRSNPGEISPCGRDDSGGESRWQGGRVAMAGGASHGASDCEAAKWVGKPIVQNFNSMMAN